MSGAFPSSKRVCKNLINHARVKSVKVSRTTLNRKSDAIAFNTAAVFPFYYI